jgi:preprotein translocase subunit SecD
MKIALLSAFAIITFSGCTKTYNSPTVNQVFSAVYTVQANQWAQGKDSDGTVYYYTSLSVPELTQAIDLNGGVVTYLSFDDATSTSPTYEAMPEVFNGVAYGSIHTTGSVTIDLRGADGSSLTSAISAPTLIKVILMDATPLGN